MKALEEDSGRPLPLRMLVQWFSIRVGSERWILYSSEIDGKGPGLNIRMTINMMIAIIKITMNDSKSYHIPKRIEGERDREREDEQSQG